MPLLADFASGLIELLAPEACALCGISRDGRRWCARGAQVRGLRRWDAPHLCGACADRLSPALAPEACGAKPDRAGGGPCGFVWCARSTDAALVTVVGAWKYEGLRGLAWPLAELAAAAAARARAELGPSILLAPVPLHRRRQRARGFNQAELLARLVGCRVGWPVADSLLKRLRATPQQARLADEVARVRNVAGACRARCPSPADPCREVLLVDDIVTSGATVAEASRALAAAGWRVLGALALGARMGAAG